MQRQMLGNLARIFCKEPVTLQASVFDVLFSFRAFPLKQASSQLSQNGMPVDLERLRHDPNGSEVCRPSSIPEPHPQPATPVFGVGARPTSCHDTRQVCSDVPWGEALSASSGTSTEHREGFYVQGSRNATPGRRKHSLGLRNREGSRCSSSDFPIQTVTAPSVSYPSRRGQKPARKPPAQPIRSTKDGQPENLLDASMLAEVFGRDRSNEIEKVLEQWQEYQLLRSELSAQDLKREVRSLRGELTRAEAEVAEARQVEAGNCSGRVGRAGSRKSRGPLRKTGRARGISRGVKATPVFKQRGVKATPLCKQRACRTPNCSRSLRTAAFTA